MACCSTASGIVKSKQKSALERIEMWPCTQKGGYKVRTDLHVKLVENKGVAVARELEKIDLGNESVAKGKRERSGATSCR